MLQDTVRVAIWRDWLQPVGTDSDFEIAEISSRLNLQHAPDDANAQLLDVQ